MMGITVVFLLAYAGIVLNMGANQMVVRDAGALLQNNYPSVKYLFNMFQLLEALNSDLLASVQPENREDSGQASLMNTQKFIPRFREQLELQRSNITEPGEKELTETLEKAFDRYQQSAELLEFRTNISAYSEKHQHLKESILALYEMNISLLESKNESIKNSTLRVLRIQRNAGITGLTLLALLILLMPVYIMNPIDKLRKRMSNFYKAYFQKDLHTEDGNELDKLEEIFEKIALEVMQKEQKQD